MSLRSQRASENTSRLRVSISAPVGQERELHFETTFRIGRTEECEVCIQDEYVSRAHAEVSFENGEWYVRDLQSSNGIFIDQRQVPSARIAERVTVRLGIYGPVVTLEVEPAQKAPLTGNETLLARYIDHYFAGTGPGEAGEHTMIVRQAFARVQSRQKWTYRAITAVLGLAVLGIGSYAIHERRASQKQRALAQDLFYGMKSLDVDIANVETNLRESNAVDHGDRIDSYQSSRRKMERDYDRLLSTLHVYDTSLTEKDRLILRVTRIFGECELDMPRDFAAEINKYIGYWHSSDRLARAVRSANENGYTARITEELLAQDLPPQFFYLALQESNFDPYVSGPNTRKGIAKGMWQFIPETGAKYGLRIGPLVDLRRPDPGDDRDHWDRETVAAAQYLKDLYRTDAQASGFLVMASYNWGEDQVLPLIRSLPANPKERNFWRLLSAYRDKIPRETFDYVFYIAAAAVIGENPRLFGFDFDNPLGALEAR